MLLKNIFTILKMSEPMYAEQEMSTLQEHTSSPLDI